MSSDGCSAHLMFTKEKKLSGGQEIQDRGTRLHTVLRNTNYQNIDNHRVVSVDPRQRDIVSCYSGDGHYFSYTEKEFCDKLHSDDASKRRLG